MVLEARSNLLLFLIPANVTTPTMIFSCFLVQYLQFTLAITEELLFSHIIFEMHTCNRYDKSSLNASRYYHNYELTKIGKFLVAELTNYTEDKRFICSSCNPNSSRDFSNSVVLVKELNSKPLHLSNPVSPYLDLNTRHPLNKVFPIL
jgi:hypothetical protein